MNSTKTILTVLARPALLCLCLCLGLLPLSVGCSRDENVRGAGSIDVPKPDGMMTAEEAATITGSGAPDASTP